MIKDGRVPFLVVVHESATRDTQITNERDNCEICTYDEQCAKGECPMPIREFYDFKGDVVVSVYHAKDRASAILTCSLDKGIHVSNLRAFQLVGGKQ